jgi:GT2 family glycosyltransferase
MTVIDNSNGKLGDRYKGAEHVTVYIPSVPLTFQQTSNLECWLAKQRGAKYYVHMHSDAQFPTERIGELLDIARRADGKRWLVIFTLYDILCVYNVAAMEDLGGYDAHLFHLYHGDNDLWRRAKLSGYERIEAGGEGIIHNGGGSATINSDSRWKICNDNQFPLSAEIFRRKWGGNPEHETYTAPFNRPDVFTDMKPVIP